jgi:hypothetical protein
MIYPKPKLTDEFIKDLHIKEWNHENDELCRELEIPNAHGIIARKVSLEIINALLHDALEYRKLIDDI